MKKGIFCTIVILLLILIVSVLIVYLVRAFSVREIDDVNPGIQCDNELLEKSDILWVIPLFNNDSIANYMEWCKNILSLNKTLEIHGVYHAYKEFNEPRSEEYLLLGINEFEKCFGRKPDMFKAPQMALDRINKESLKEAGLRNRDPISQVFHKVYHCSDTGKFSNRFNDLF